MCVSGVGRIVSKNKEVMFHALKFTRQDYPPTFGQIAGAAALCTPFSYFDEVSKEYVSRRDLLIEGLNKIDGVVCPKPKGAFFINFFPITC